MADVSSVIEFCFTLGLKHSEIRHILSFLFREDISIRSLRRLLAKQGLFRRKNYSDILDIALFITENVEKSGQLHGYKLTHLKCIQNSFVVSQDVVRILLQIIDPDGVQIRKRNRLRRRKYFSSGPDYMWHVDSYDKLKPYGFCINGCIDGFSRQIIWMQTFTTNSDPSLIASYYIDAIKLRKGCPRKLRLDHGTENSHISQMQMFLRYDHEDEDAHQSVIYGSSNHNQRIECWWGYLRKQCCQFWMNLFQTLKDEESFTGDFLDKNVLQFCFMQIIQDELDEIVEMWNVHRIRPYRNRNIPCGRPMVMYNLPHLYRKQAQICRVSNTQIEIGENECSPKSCYPCDETMYDLCCLLMLKENYDVPSSPDEALLLYHFLRNSIRFIIL